MKSLKGREIVYHRTEPEISREKTRSRSHADSLPHVYHDTRLRTGHDYMQQLQRAIGNHGVQRLFNSGAIQAKSIIGLIMKKDASCGPDIKDYETSAGPLFPEKDVSDKVRPLKERLEYDAKEQKYTDIYSGEVYAKTEMDCWKQKAETSKAIFSDLVSKLTKKSKTKLDPSADVDAIISSTLIESAAKKLKVKPSELATRTAGDANATPEKDDDCDIRVSVPANPFLRNPALAHERIHQQHCNVRNENRKKVEEKYQKEIDEANKLDEYIKFRKLSLIKRKINAEVYEANNIDANTHLAEELETYTEQTKRLAEEIASLNKVKKSKAKRPQDRK